MIKKKPNREYKQYYITNKLTRSRDWNRSASHVSCRDFLSTFLIAFESLFLLPSPTPHPLVQKNKNKKEDKYRQRRKQELMKSKQSGSQCTLQWRRVLMGVMSSDAVTGRQQDVN